MDLKSRLGPVLAVTTCAAIVVWMVSGGHGITRAKAEVNEQQETIAEPAKNPNAFRVQARISNAIPFQQRLTLSGETQANTVLNLTNRVAGHVIKVHAQKGQFLNAGDPIISIDTRIVKANLAQAEALVTQRKLELQGVRRLQNQQLTSQVSVASAQAALDTAEATVIQLQVELENAVIEAPFAGLLNDFDIQKGQWLDSGVTVAQLVDVTPLKATINVPQIDIDQLSIGTPAELALGNGAHAKSNVSFISAVADSATRTVPIEVSIENFPPYMTAGLSVHADFILGSRSAHPLSPALLSINAQGNTALKLLNNDNQVKEVEVEILRSERDKVWVSGLPPRARIITVGQGFVEDGDVVQVQMQQ